MASQKQDRDKKQQRGPPALEWAAAFMGAMIATGMLVFLGQEALQTGDGQPPILEVRPRDLVAKQGLHILQVTVANRSGHTAAAVQIEGVLKQGGREIETSTATLSYVPGHSERHAGLIFVQDPRRHDVELRATGYEEP